MINLPRHSTHETSTIPSDFDPSVVLTHPKYPAPLEFDWSHRWLRGEEYAYMLKNIDLYCKTFNLTKLPAKTHPNSIYREPQDGMIYFVEGSSVGSDFGFPRVDAKKRYRWKKMNFTTDLPKRRPCVTYIVASAVKCGKFFPNNREEGPSFRMHAVILNKEGVRTQKYKEGGQGQTCLDEPHSSLSTTCSSIADNAELEKTEFNNEDSREKKNVSSGSKSYVLCHIRKIDSAYRSRMPRNGQCEDEEEEEEGSDIGKAPTPSKKLFFEQTAIVQPKHRLELSHSKINKSTLLPQKMVTFNNPLESFASALTSSSKGFSPPSFSAKESLVKEPKESISKTLQTSKMSLNKDCGNTEVSKQQRDRRPINHSPVDLLKEVNQNEVQNVDYIKMFASLVNYKSL